MQPTDERRRTGSHYTPRSLTQPIVEHALEPAFERIGPDATPEDVLALKVCDPAMGSGAFLVEACRALGERLVAGVGALARDAAEHSRRTRTSRCTRAASSPSAASTASTRTRAPSSLRKLSLWLATLARDHEFTFLDHALKSGDSLVGLDAKQISALHWDLSKPGLPLFRKFVADRVAEATRARAEIQSAPDDTARAILEQKHRAIEGVVADVRTLGDAVISAFFAEVKPKAREKRRATVESFVAGSPVKWDSLREAAASLRTGVHPLSPFHWPAEFPEVFARDNPGFDAIVGNPPFLGGTNISGEHGVSYKDWLATVNTETQGKGDLCAHFYRKAFYLVRTGACFGLIATNTISQGATREMGLRVILRNGTILSAVPRLKWPGAAAVVVSVVHILKGPSPYSALPLLAGTRVPRVSAYLVKGDYDEVRFAWRKTLARHSREARSTATVLRLMTQTRSEWHLRFRR